MVYEPPAEKLKLVQPETLSTVSLDMSSDNGIADPALPDLNPGPHKAPSLPIDTGSPPSSHRPGRN